MAAKMEATTILRLRAFGIVIETPTPLVVNLPSSVLGVIIILRGGAGLSVGGIT